MCRQAIGRGTISPTGARAGTGARNDSPCAWPGGARSTDRISSHALYFTSGSTGRAGCGPAPFPGEESASDAVPPPGNARHPAAKGRATASGSPRLGPSPTSVASRALPHLRACGARGRAFARQAGDRKRLAHFERRPPAIFRLACSGRSPRIPALLSSPIPAIDAPDTRANTGCYRSNGRPAAEQPSSSTRWLTLLRLRGPTTCQRINK